MYVVSLIVLLFYLSIQIFCSEYYSCVQYSEHMGPLLRGLPHHESRDHGLGGVGGQVQHHVGATLPLGLDQDAVAGQAGPPRQLVGLQRRCPAHPEGGGADPGEQDVGGGRDAWGHTETMQGG